MDLKPRATSVDGDGDPVFCQIGRSAAPAAAATMACCTQSSLHQQTTTFRGPIVAPSVPLSLRTRETASLSLRHIFHQHMSGNGSVARQDREWRPAQQTGGLYSSGNRPLPDMRKRDSPELEPTRTKIQDSSFANDSSSFGPPIPRPTVSSQERLLMNKHIKQQAPFARGSPSTCPPAGQMTIFYSGTVNVYDDIPVDKAYAIMLLARNTWSAKTRCPTPSAKEPGTPSSITEMSFEKEKVLLPMKAASTKSEAPSPMILDGASWVSIERNVSNPTSLASAKPILTTAGPLPTPAQVSQADGISKPAQNAGVSARRSKAIELPISRKASLARFLEKRKDRVHGQELDSDQRSAAAKRLGGEGEEKAKAGEGQQPALCSSKRPGGVQLGTPCSTRPCISSGSSAYVGAARNRRTAAHEHDAEGAGFY